MTGMKSQIKLYKYGSKENSSVTHDILNSGHFVNAKFVEISQTYNR